MAYKEWLAGIAAVLTFAGFYPYISGIMKGRIKPHMFSWVIWGLSTCVVFLAQLAARGGAGAWVIGFSGGITVFIAVLSFIRRGDIAITRTDWMFFMSALSSLPLWCWTSDPMWAVIVLTAVDLFGFGPTFRKAYDDPFSESLVFFGIFLIRNLIVIVALEAYSVATVLFPAVISGACGVLMATIMIRRKMINNGIGIGL